jgi:hypothetical protein
MNLMYVPKAAERLTDIGQLREAILYGAQESASPLQALRHRRRKLRHAQQGLYRFLAKTDNSLFMSEIATDAWFDHISKV